MNDKIKGVKRFTVMLKKDRENAGPGQTRFIFTREGIIEYEDGSMEMSIGWHEFQISIKIDNATLSRLGNPELLNVNIEPSR